LFNFLEEYSNLAMIWSAVMAFYEDQVGFMINYHYVYENQPDEKFSVFITCLAFQRFKIIA